MCDRVLSDISSAFSSTILYAPSWVGDARTKPELRYGWDFSANNFGNASGLFRSSCGSENLHPEAKRVYDELSSIV